MTFEGNIYLVGPMGVGKTTIGKVLGEQLGLEFFDSDREIEAVTGADIPWIFDVEGEAGFRIRETKMIADLTAKNSVVVATGGGSVLAEENRQRLSENGTVVYLRASEAQQLERTSRDKSRPLLQTPNPAKKIKELMATREPLYQEVADIIIDTNRRNPRSVSNEILARLQQLKDSNSAEGDQS
jgi:shikimate kinase